ncbi:hypothetical protein EMPS_05185 [Entomortierella parvispora]|uniref:F-box domain-containing protein n=1 Tax=Entomortierella parvispora TaxID=205924 RepID=A0A9P3HAN7_9FUNG|nr:hypothetical protein EMPS_05185 [Entomortierella parvispora]
MLRHREIQPGQAPGQDTLQGAPDSPRRRPHPLAIPEILCLLAEFLDQQTTLDAMKVSRAWRTAFTPYLWKDAQMNMSMPEREPPYNTVLMNAHFVHTLRLRCKHTVALKHPILPFSLSNFPTCRNLSKLTIEIMDTNNNGTLFSLILQHSMFLTSVSLTAAVGPLENPSDLWNALVKCIHLRQLEYAGMRLTDPSEHMELYLMLWSRLDVLKLSGDWCAPGTLDNPVFIIPKGLDDPISEIPGSGRLRDLTIEGTHMHRDKMKAQAWMIKQCSATLTRLYWKPKSWLRAVEKASPMNYVFSLIAMGQCPNLETLLMPGLDYSLDIFTELVKKMRRLTEIDLAATNFGFWEWTTLQTLPWHMSAIRVLHLEGCLNMTGVIIQDMLCSLPSLESFKAGNLWDIDIIDDPRPWICKDLKELVLTIVFRTSPHPHRMIQSRLSSLLRLEICELNRPHDECFRMTLQSGLDRLGSLRRMRRFHVQAGKDAPWAMWKEEEVEWALKHWPFLEELSGVALTARAQQLLCRHRIRYAPTRFRS